MASGNVIPSDGTNIIQTSQGFPSVAVQVSGAIPYPQYGAQQFGTSTGAPQQVPQTGRLERFLNAEIKVLGTVQIMIGLMHIGFGAVAICLASAGYIAWSIGYSFWGGILFISSGSLCISAAKHQNRSLVKCSIGMNITSAIIALIGILQYILEISFSLNENSEDWKKNVGICLSSVLFLFKLLEFFITVSLAHFGCQANCCTNGSAAMGYVPYQIVSGFAPLATEPNSSSPPTYDNVAKPE
ncbi:membrane-spanning 4-domains subfamily A member 12-like isoform X2 [Ahaetulla prasina]|nr:membrane-spanning 4-domains subfamily A member 12-like isoform X2 [Ahaetulla prasina]XP_058010991.1 membrane-spanning 4-domains subfamily A member 12-like isoform X2 [Ahaetulla prasina]XP_058011000.1 membrane-spanning 4-domains subfamily A member 12-like isoform X2 [Ahaetulla prasina]XP_058011006.1 membrane-spanning 4-domains subfamily A member 12-like isoform X2 [Ahaetulla prasina]